MWLSGSDVSVVRGFERVRDLSAELQEELVGWAIHAATTQLEVHGEHDVTVRACPIADLPDELPAGWGAVVGAADPREAIEALFSQCSPRVRRIGEVIAAATTHVLLATTKDGPRLIYVYVLPMHSGLEPRHLVAYPPTKDDEVTRIPLLSELYGVHGGLVRWADDGLYPVSRWTTMSVASKSDRSVREHDVQRPFPRELVCVGNPVTSESSDAVIGCDLASSPPAAWALLDDLELVPLPDLLVDLEEHLVEAAAFWEDVDPLGLAVGDIELRALDGSVDLSKAAVHTLLVARYRDDEPPLAEDEEGAELTQEGEDDDRTSSVGVVVKVGAKNYRAGRGATVEEAIAVIDAAGWELLEEEAGAQLDAADGRLLWAPVALSSPELEGVRGAFADALEPQSTTALRTDIARGGEVRVKGGWYALKEPLRLTQSVSLVAEGPVVFVGPREGYAIEIAAPVDARVSLEGIDVHARHASGVLVKSGVVELQDLVLIGETRSGNPLGVRVEGDASLHVRRAYVRGFDIAFDLGSRGQAQLADVVLFENGDGIGVSGRCEATVERVVAWYQDTASFVATQESKLSLRDCQSRYAQIGYFAAAQAELAVDACEAFDARVAGVRARGEARIVARGLRTVRCTDGAGAIERGHVTLSGWESERGQTGAFCRDQGTLIVSEATLHAPRANGLLAIGGSLSARAVQVVRSGGAAFRATDQGHLVLEGCLAAAFDQRSAGLLAELAGARVEARDCVVEACWQGAVVVQGAALDLQRCTFRRSSRYAVWTRGAGTVALRDCTFEQSAFGDRHDEPEAKPHDEPAEAPDA